MQRSGTECTRRVLSWAAELVEAHGGHVVQAADRAGTVETWEHAQAAEGSLQQARIKV